MELIDQTARVGTAGYVLGRLLVKLPNQALAGNFGDVKMRETWPLRDAQTMEALASLQPDHYADVARDYASLFLGEPRVALQESAWRGGEAAAALADVSAYFEASQLQPVPQTDNVGHQFTLLGHVTARMGREPENAAELAAIALDLRANHLDRVIEQILQGISRHARTYLYRALPGLARGFLAEHSAVCAAVLAKENLSV